MGSGSKACICARGYQMVSADKKVTLIKISCISTIHTIQSQNKIIVEELIALYVLHKLEWEIN